MSRRTQRSSYRPGRPGARGGWLPRGPLPVGALWAARTGIAGLARRRTAKTRSPDPATTGPGCPAPGGAGSPPWVTGRAGGQSPTRLVVGERARVSSAGAPRGGQVRGTAQNHRRLLIV